MPSSSVSPPSPPPLPQPTHLPADGDENDVAAAATSDDEENIRCRRYLYLTHDELESSDWCGDLSRLLSPADAEVVPSDNDAEEQPDKRDSANVIDKKSRFAEGALVWVLTSKGKNKKKRTNSSPSGGAAMENQKSNLKLRGERKARKNNRKEKKQRGDRSKEDAISASTTTNVTSPPFKVAAPATTGDEVIKKLDDGSDKATPSQIVDDDDCRKEGEDVSSPSTFGHRGRSELFKRARVVSDDEENFVSASERRVLVRYSKGATYRVRAVNLIPVLEPVPSPLPPHPSSSVSPPPMVLVAPETYAYRRLAVVHAVPGDSFLEIGCDYGITVDRVRRALEDGGDVPRNAASAVVKLDTDNGESTISANEAILTEEKKPTCLGIDKSQESIDVATSRYPRSKFVMGDVFVEEEMTQFRTLCEHGLVGGSPSVVAIDINGNREIEGVVRCIQTMMDQPWKRGVPRLIIVKSRFLYWHMKGKEDEGE